jgi:hypothetical protein
LGIVGLLAGVGIVLGIVWHLWSRTPTAGLVYTSHSIVPDETEGFISSDGRFAVLTGAIGLLAGVLAWTRRAYRGPAIATALTVGGVLGAILTDVIGRLLGGGKDTGTLNTVLARLPLQVHAIGLVGLEAALALLAYLLPALFVTADDLGREPAAARPTVD